MLTELECPALTSDTNAGWPTTLSGTTALGTCVAGYTGGPSRDCDLTGAWQDVSNPCGRTGRAPRAPPPPRRPGRHHHAAPAGCTIAS